MPLPFFKTSQRCRPTLSFFIVSIRIILIVSATVNLCALSAAFQIYSPKDSTYNGTHDFQDSPQFVFNAFLFLAALYSFFGSSRWSRRIRILSGLILLAANAALVITQFKSIGDSGGCSRGPTFNTTRFGEGNRSGNENIGSPMTPRLRCIIQMVVGGIGIIWSVLLAIELALTDLQRRRELDQKDPNNIGRDDSQGQQGMSAPTSIVHLYQPDLSMYDSAGNERTSRIGDSMELESLPAYEQRPSGPRAQIIDMANIRHMSRPARGTSLRRPAQDVIQSPPPSYQAANT